uniref:D-isomer specific 2-hydroxyacid dehydrogenase NAD-binding domain-containing protein n=1 Tax=Kalanchoe fedtschenkoi TaxID=63787 RepID=A0A7N0UPQ8_KALFE
MATLEIHNISDELPLLFVHRIPQFGVFFKTRLLTKFRLFDPLSPSEDSDVDALRNSARVLLCVGPSRVTADTLAQLPELRVVVGSSAGIDHIDLDECKRRGIAVTNAGDAFSADVADYAVGMLIGVLRKVNAGDRFVRRGMWLQGSDFQLGSKVGGKRIGIVGLGSIGYLIAKRLKAFGCAIAYNSRKEKPSVPFQYYRNVVELAEDSEVLIVCCALTDETYHIINKDVMRALGKDGVIINVGRGNLVDEDELVKALLQGELGGAGLDVFENEPGVPEELFKLDNVVLSPHKAALTPESFAAVEDVVFSHLIREEYNYYS